MPAALLLLVSALAAEEAHDSIEWAALETLDVSVEIPKKWTPWERYYWELEHGRPTWSCTEVADEDEQCDVMLSPGELWNFSRIHILYHPWGRRAKVGTCRFVMESESDIWRYLECGGGTFARDWEPGGKKGRLYAGHGLALLGGRTTDKVLRDKWTAFGYASAGGSFILALEGAGTFDAEITVFEHVVETFSPRGVLAQGGGGAKSKPRRGKPRRKAPKAEMLPLPD